MPVFVSTAPVPIAGALDVRSVNAFAPRPRASCSLPVRPHPIESATVSSACPGSTSTGARTDRPCQVTSTSSPVPRPSLAAVTTPRVAALVQVSLEIAVGSSRSQALLAKRPVVHAWIDREQDLEPLGRRGRRAGQGALERRPAERDRGRRKRAVVDHAAHQRAPPGSVRQALAYEIVRRDGGATCVERKHLEQRPAAEERLDERLDDRGRPIECARIPPRLERMPPAGSRRWTRRRSRPRGGRDTRSVGLSP